MLRIAPLRFLGVGERAIFTLVRHPMNAPWDQGIIKKWGLAVVSLSFFGSR